MGKYKLVLSTELLDWFDDNYSESRDECAMLVLDAQRDYPITAKQLKNGCVELKKIMDESLYVHIKLIGDLSNVGISSNIAVESIRKALQSI